MDAITEYTLSFSCPDRLGVVAKQSSLFYDAGAYITDIDVFTDPVSKRYFSRCVFDTRELKVSIETFKQRLAELADEIDMDYLLRAEGEKPRVLIAVSKYDHCLNSLIHKWKSGALQMDIVGVMSNHDDCRAVAEWNGLPYYHLPITKETKPQQEAQILELLETHKVDLLVLARYMQILSNDLCDKLQGRAINIHHSFLPGFKGAKPYHQAYERGVKVVGATAHYVTSDLDEGPIIVQEVRAIDHGDSAEKLVHMGHDTEAVALSNAVGIYCEQRVFMNGNRTVIF
jgi:formyltetrahydrofolate deformylase